MSFNPKGSDQQDLSQEALDNFKDSQGIKLVGKTGRSITRKGLHAAGKITVALAKSVISALIGLVAPLGIFLGIIIVLILILFAGIYWGMSEESILTDAVAQAHDIEAEKYATNRADKGNVFNTWLVPGESQKSRLGSWHKERIEWEKANELPPDNKKSLFAKYSTEDMPIKEYIDKDGSLKVKTIYDEGDIIHGWSFLGKLMDNDGKDQSLKNYWGDMYAPVLFDSLRFNNDNLMNDEYFRNEGFNDTGFEIRPYFYYKPSTITVTVVTEKGSHTYQYNIFLLVEAYSIRGHYQYGYEWRTTVSGNTTTTREYLKDTHRLDDGKEYLTTYLEKRLELEPAEKALMVDSVFEAMQGFTAKKEWMKWLLENNISQNQIISASAIPSEYFSMLQEASVITGIPTHVLAAIIMKESSWNPNAINEKSGCFGLTQLNPLFWEEWAVRYGFDPVTDQWNPRAQIIIGAQVLRGYMGSLPNFKSNNWDQDPSFRAAVAMYGGYGTDVAKAAGYINDIVAKAKAYNAKAVFPVLGFEINNITSGFGYRKHPLTGEYKLHGGIDVGCPTGSTVVSASAGIVTDTVRSSGKFGTIYGNYIIITDTNYKYLYAHLSDIQVTVGQSVTPGAKIGLSGNSGDSSGPHLHFGISTLEGDPRSYEGAVNPIPILLR